MTARKEEEFDGHAEALRRIAECKATRAEALDLSGLGLTEFPEEVLELGWLRQLDLGRSWIDHRYYDNPLASLPRVLPSKLSMLQNFSIAFTQVSDLTVLAKMHCLQSLNCSGTSILDLLPLADLSGLRRLDCTFTAVSDITPLVGLQNLQAVDLSRTEVNDLSPLANLCGLQSLFIYDTRVSDLSRLASVHSLEILDCWLTPVADLLPLTSLRSLRILNCSATQIDDLTPLHKLQRLQSLDCSFTEVSDLLPLRNLNGLQSVNCSNTLVADLSPLIEIQTLEELFASSCKISEAPLTLWHKPALQKVDLFRSKLPGIPEEVLSQSDDDNCLPSLRAHLDDLGNVPQPLSDAKLMILGNGRIGKTQLARRLRGEDYEADADSTHGIIVSEAPVPEREDEAPARFQIWDFGGQDLYHGTHALFMRSRAVFLVCWTPEMEDSETHEHGGMRFRNYPLAYWLDHVRQFAAEGAPVIVVQTQCDAPANRRPLAEGARETLDRFEHGLAREFSAKTGRGLSSLREALAEAYDDLNQPLIGPGRAAVKRQLEEWRSADAARPVAEREHQTLVYEEFRALCEEAGKISDPDMLLRFLHNAGTVFYQKDLFGNQIILDQGWALDAIYSVFHRQACYRALKGARGRFTRADLGAYLWDETFSREEQQLFLSMMQSCGVCFKHDWRVDEDETVYVAPELLPAERAPYLDRLWPEGDATIEQRTLRFAVLPATLIRGIIAEIGAKARLDAEYWASGVTFSEATTGSEALIEQIRETPEGWSGAIEIRTRALPKGAGRPAELLERLSKIVLRQAARFGLEPEMDEAAEQGRARALQRDEKEEQPLQFTQVKPSLIEHAVSYAWGDDTPEGREREEVVDKTCDAYAAKGITILRDKTHLSMGESISKFMARIGKADRVFVFLSDRYLKSPACMRELMEIWRIRQGDEDQFFRHVRIFALDGADIWSIEARATYADYWEQRFEKLRDRAHLLGERDSAAWRNMRQFAHNVGEILAGVADRIQPRTFEQFLEYKFEDPDAEGDRRTHSFD